MPLPEIPPFFNKLDFLGILLPGYLAVTVFVLTFTPDLLFNPGRALSFDLFSAIVFIVAGPAVGQTLRQLHRHASVVGARLATKDTRKQLRDYVENYFRLRVTCTTEEKLELDRAEADYDFSVSTGLAFLSLGAYHLLTRGQSQIHIPILFFVLSLIFFIGGAVERAESFTPVVETLLRKYPSA